MKHHATAQFNWHLDNLKLQMKWEEYSKKAGWTWGERGMREQSNLTTNKGIIEKQECSCPSLKMQLEIYLWSSFHDHANIIQPEDTLLPPLYTTPAINSLVCVLQVHTLETFTFSQTYEQLQSQHSCWAEKCGLIFTIKNSACPPHCVDFFIYVAFSRRFVIHRAMIKCQRVNQAHPLGPSKTDHNAGLN